MPSCLPLSFRFEAENSLIKLLPKHLEDYLTNTAYIHEEIILHLRENESLGSVRSSDGWSLCQINGVEQAVYVSEGRACFSLIYDASENEVTVCIRKAVDSFVRIGALYGILTALHQSCIGFHGVTVVSGNEIIILSAPSGTGKTTLAKLLEKYCDGIIINGDFALLHPTNDGIIFEPTPFCGTSGRCLNHRLKVDRVVFLGQAETNMWRKLCGREALQNFLHNTFVPTWDKGLQEAVQINIVKCVSKLKVNQFSFAPNQEAAEIFIQHIINDDKRSSTN